jgi:class 3 adenylate cyclase
MPNLNQIYGLKHEFYTLDAKDRKILDYLEKTGARDVLKKAFDSERLNENARETRTFAFVTENLNPDKPELIKYFEEGKEEDVALLFIDITSFSKTIFGWPNDKIKEYLDDYYSKIIPIIYDNGGEIEKLMGDGIICVFGKPFLDLDYLEYVYKAEDCAEAVIKKFHNSDKNVKVAIHKGKINYYKVPGEFYGEYTIIGQPITELYRLESVSLPNAINFYTGSTYDFLGWTYSRFDNSIVNCHGLDIRELQGVDFSQIKYMKFPGYL